MIFLTAGHNKSDSGAVYNGRKEADETVRLRNAITADLKKKAVPVWNDMDQWNLGRTIMEISAMSKPEDIICDLHFNAGPVTATGCEVLVPDEADEKELKLANELVIEVSNCLSIKNRGVKKESEGQHSKLGMMRPVGINVLIEVCFISNSNDMQKFDNRFDSLVVNIAAILGKYLI